MEEQNVDITPQKDLDAETLISTGAAGLILGQKLTDLIEFLIEKCTGFRSDPRMEKAVVAYEKFVDVSKDKNAELGKIDYNDAVFTF